MSLKGRQKKKTCAVSIPLLPALLAICKRSDVPNRLMELPSPPIFAKEQTRLCVQLEDDTIGDGSCYV